MCVCMCARAPSHTHRGGLLEPMGLGPHPPVAMTTTSVRTWGLKNCECGVREGGDTPESHGISDHRTL